MFALLRRKTITAATGAALGIVALQAIAPWWLDLALGLALVGCVFIAARAGGGR